MNKKDIIKRLDTMVPKFLARKKTHPTEDHSQVFIIFAHNYQDLKMYLKREEMIQHISDFYLESKLIKHMQDSVDARNKNWIRKQSGLKLDSKLTAFSEFFVCAVSILPFLKHKKSYKSIMNKLSKHHFNIDRSSKSGLKLIKG